MRMICKSIDITNIEQHTFKELQFNSQFPYQTRHTFASTLLSRGENPLWVAQQMGHKDWGQIIKIYGQWIPPSK